MTARDLDDVTRLLSKLVAISSVTPRDAAPSVECPGEQALGEFVVAWLGARGVEAELQHVLPGRPNVVAVVRGVQQTAVLLETHLDTVEVDGMERPFSPRVSNGRLYGRGAADAKASLAAFMLVLARLAQAPTPPRHTVVLAAVADEEHAYRGVLAFLRERTGEGAWSGQILGAIVGEPTGLAPGIAHTGCVRATIRTHGKAGHSSRPSEAMNAIALAVRVVRAIEDRPPLVRHPLLGHATRAVTRISAGEGPNVIPGVCEIDFDRRTLPGEDAERVLDDLRSEMERELPGRVTIDDPFTVDTPLDTPPEADIVVSLCDALREAGRAAAPVGLPFGTDASKISRAGIPAVVFGPGDISDAHTIHESVDLGQVRAAVELVFATVQRLESISQIPATEGELV